MRTAIPLETGTLHFVGIGGIGMSGIAEILHNLGYKIQGSDSQENANVKRLRDKGVRIFIGQAAENVQGISVLVISSAIKPDNPEVQAARAARVPVVNRAEMLAELARLKWSVAIAGTHGKTTTTTLTATVLDQAGFDPTVINGGIVNAYGTNARLGSGDWIVLEADESDGTFLKVRPTIAVVTNVDPEHLDHYGSVEALHQAFADFIHSIPFYGAAILCLDHPVIQGLIPKVQDRKVVTYGLSPQADIRAEEIEQGPAGSTFTVVLPDDSRQQVRLPMPGLHNVQNALAAIGVAWQLAISAEIIGAALASFKGVKRRFTVVDTVDGITIVDDYGHHPVEIASVLKAARTLTEGQVIAVVQPHRYSRVQDLFNDFACSFFDADQVIVADIYAAGEAPLPGIDKDHLAEAIRAHGHKAVHVLPTPEDLPRLVKDLAQSGDYVLCLGAGTVTQWAQSLPQQLESL